MKTFATLRSILLSGCILLAVPGLHAQPVAGSAAPKPVGRVVAVRGKVEAVSPTNVRRALAIRESIFEGDTVNTGARGRVQISFSDGTIVHLGRNTEMLIDEYEYSAEKSSGKMVTHVKSGVFRVMGGAITKIAPDNFRTVTPTATIGIRGSFYMGSVNQQVLKVVFLGGRGIWVRNEHGGEDIETPGYGTSVRPGERPAAPRRYAVQELTSLVDDLLAVGEEEDDDGPAPDGDDDDDDGGLPPIDDGDDDDDDDDTPIPPAETQDSGEQDPASQVQQESTRDSQDRDATPPIVTVVAQETRDATPTLTGTVDDPTATVSVTIGGQAFDAVNQGDGTWELDGASFAGAPLADDTYEVVAQALDAAGNPGQGQGSLLIDTTPPLAAADPLTRRDFTPALTGTIDDPEVAVEVTVNGVVYPAENNGDGTWGLAGALIATPLSDGSYDVSVAATDRLGNPMQENFADALTVTTAGAQSVGRVDGETAAGGVSLDVRDVGEASARAAGDLLFSLSVDGVAPAEPGGIYAGTATTGGEHTVSLSGNELGVPFSHAYDNLGEFFVFTAGLESAEYGNSRGGRGTVNELGEPPDPAENPDAYAVEGAYLSMLDDGEGYDFVELGFAGIPSYVLPKTGLAAYSGPLLLVEGQPDGTTFSELSGAITARANFRSGKVMGNIVTDQGATGLTFVGDISGAGLENVVLLGGGVADGGAGGAEGMPFVLNTADAFGQFYGSAHQGLGLYLEAEELALLDQASVGDLSLAGGLYLASELFEVPGGQVAWSGFVIGVAEDIEAPDQDPVLLLNALDTAARGSNTGLSLQLDRDNGTVTGWMSLSTPEGDAEPFVLQIGGPSQSADGTATTSSTAADGGRAAATGSNSAYVSDKGFAAELAAIESVRSLSTNQNGNYMVTAPVEEQVSDWLTWGYWAASYQGANGEIRHVHMPGAYWVAGEPTPRSYIRSLIGTTGAMGVYSGGALCTTLQNGLPPEEMTGTSNLTVFFDTRLVNGTLAFPELSLNATGVVDPAGNGFSGSIASVNAGTAGGGAAVTPVTSQLQGDFFGPEANAVGGSFAAEVASPNSQAIETRYIGVFAADK